MTCVFICVCGCQCAITPKGSCREEDRPHAMFPFEMEKDREGEMKGNRQSQGELASIFGSCGLPYLALFFLQASERHTRIIIPRLRYHRVTHQQSFLLGNITKICLHMQLFVTTHHP